MTMKMKDRKRKFIELEVQLRSLKAGYERLLDILSCEVIFDMKGFEQIWQATLPGYDMPDIGNAIHILKTTLEIKVTNLERAHGADVGHSTGLGGASGLTSTERGEPWL